MGAGHGVAGADDLAVWLMEAKGEDPMRADSNGNNTAHYAACCGRTLPVLMWINRPPAICTDAIKYLKKHETSVSGGEAYM